MTLETPRLVLRTPTLDDAPSLARAINDERIARTTLLIPHPYTVEDAVKWINSLADPDKQANVQLSIFLKDTLELIGGIGLSGVDLKNKKAELGYWCSVDYWGKGIVTEAASRVVRYGFDELGLERIMAICMVGNPASARVMEKIGMKFEGTARHEYMSNGEYGDYRHYAILSAD